MIIIEPKIQKLLLKLAKKAAKKGEIPVSAVVINNNKVVSYSYNKKEQKKDITAHAEILAIKKAAKKLKRWNLSDCILYVSLKPCAMCYEIIKQSRLEKVVYFLDKPNFKKDFNKTESIYYEDKGITNTYQQLLSDFFKNKR